MGSFLIHFGIIFVILGGFLATLGSPGVPKGGRVGKVTEKVVRGSFVGPPLGSPLEHKSTTNREKVVPRSTLENIVFKVLHKRCLRTPSDHEDDGFVIRNHRLHISTWSPKTTENGVQWVPFRTPLGGFGGPWALFWRMNE